MLEVKQNKCVCLNVMFLGLIVSKTFNSVYTIYGMNIFTMGYCKLFIFYLFYFIFFFCEFLFVILGAQFLACLQSVIMTSRNDKKSTNST